MAANKLADNSIRISDVVRILRKYGIYLLGLMILGGTLAAIWGKFQTKQYDAVALVHLDQHSSISLSASGGSSDEYGLKMQTQMIGFQSQHIAELTMRKLNLQNDPLFNGSGRHNFDDPVQRDQLVNQFLGSLSITQVPKSELLSIRFRSKSPALAASVVNTLVDVYIEESISQRYKSTKDITN
jgi:succinoglycan biosynthesis transport protein ExoP